MVLNLISEENGLDISFISYDVTFIDRCAQFTVTLKYKNISSLPLPLKFKNDNRDLGILIQLEAKVGDSGAFKIENNITSIYPLLSGLNLTNNSSNNNDNNEESQQQSTSPSITSIEELIKKLSIYDDSTTVNMNILDLLPGKEITMTSKYLKEIPIDRFEDKQPYISIVIPKQTSITSPFPPIKIEITTNGEVSIPLHSAACPSHPSSVSSLTLCENNVSSKHEINSNSLLNSDFNFIIALERELNHCGWQYSFQSNSTTTSPLLLSPPLSPNSQSLDNSNNNNNNNSSSSNDSSNIIISSSIINVCQELNKLPIDKLFINNVEYENNNNNNNNSNSNSNLVFYTIDQNNNNNSNNNVTLKYNNSEYNILLKNTTSKQLSNILNKFSSLSKIQQILNSSNSNSSNNNKIDLGLLLNFVFISPEIPTSSSSPTSSYTSPLSFSAPPERNSSSNSNNNNPLATSNIQLPNSFKLKSLKNNPVGLQLSGESLSKVLANLPRAKPSQSSTAPPTMGKVANPIADFIASRGVTGGASLNPSSKDSSSGSKTLRKPPPKLGSSVVGAGNLAGLAASTSNLTSSSLSTNNSNSLPTSGSNEDLSGMSGTDIRSARLASYNKLNKMWNVTVSDFAERHSIESYELEPFALECGLNYIKSRWWKKNRIATLQEILVIRSLVGNIIYNPQIFLACGRNSLLNIQVVNNNSGSNSNSMDNSREQSPTLSPKSPNDNQSLPTTSTTTDNLPPQPTAAKSKPPPSNFLLSKTSFTDLTKLMNKSSSSLSSLTPPPTTTTTTTTTTTNNCTNLSSSTESSSTNSNSTDELDPVKLKWIIEEVLDSEKSLFERMTSPNQENPNSKNDHLWFTISVGENKGGRPHMEDRHVIIEYPYDFYGLTSEENGVVSGGIEDSQFFFGVFDGHNGKIAAEYCRTSLPFEIYTRLAEVQKCNSLSTSKEIPEQLYIDNIKEGYINTDRHFLEYARKEDKKAGTTAATVILLRDRIVVSNCGDTEVIISQNGKAKALSTLHSPKLDSERDRIESAGGAVIHYGTLRVNGLLSVSRSLGDKNLKEYIIPDPDSIIYSICNNSNNDDGIINDFILIATDGLWEVFNYQEVVDYVFKLLADSSISNDDISSIIIDEAINRNSKDNITLLIIFLNK